MQLDEDSLIALFSQYDREATGKLRYSEVMRVLLDADSFCLWSAGGAAAAAAPATPTK